MERKRSRRTHLKTPLPGAVFLLILSYFLSSDTQLWMGFRCGIAVSAEKLFSEHLLSPFSSTTDANKSKARIVVPSSCISEDENDIEPTGVGDEGDDVLLEARSTSFGGSRNGDKNPAAFLPRDHRFYPLGSIPPIAVHRNAYHDDDEDEDEDDHQIAGRNGWGKVPLSGIEDDRSASDSVSNALSSPPPKSAFKKTGTTIAGCVVKSPRHGGPCVILAADTRATEGTLVADKKCDKIHKLASNCRCCGAGTSADLDKVTRQVLYQMALQELQGNSIGNGRDLSKNNDSGTTSNTLVTPTNGIEVLYQDYGDTHNSNSTSNQAAAGEPLLWMRPVSINLVCRIFQDHLFRNGGRVGANLIVGGVWKGKAYLRAIHPHGSSDNDLPFAALGSGGLAAMAVLEQGWNPSLTLEEGIDLVQRAILSGIRNDLGSGSQVDLCVIRGPLGSCVQTRGAIPEEELLPDGSGVDNNGGSGGDACVRERTNRLLELLAGDDEEDDDEKNTAEPTGTGEQLPAAGVNGFGNQPFAIETTKQTMTSVETDQTRRKETWDRVLGL